MAEGIQVISNRDIPVGGNPHSFGDYGTYMVKDGALQSLGSPCWVWGKFYVTVVRSILNGSWDRGRCMHLCR